MKGLLFFPYTEHFNYFFLTSLTLKISLQSFPGFGATFISFKHKMYGMTPLNLLLLHSEQF